MILSAHDTGRKALLEAMSGGPVDIDRFTVGDPWVVRVLGQSFEHADLNEALKMASQFVLLSRAK